MHVIIGFTGLILMMVPLMVASLPMQGALSCLMCSDDWLKLTMRTVTRAGLQAWPLED